jgi:hypothetical protein
MGGYMKIKMALLLSLFLLAACKSNETPNGIIAFKMASGSPQYNYYSTFFICDGTVYNDGNIGAKLCRMYITIKDTNSTTLATNSGFLDPPDVPSSAKATFAIRFDDVQKNIWNRMDKARMTWEVKYEK